MLADPVSIKLGAAATQRAPCPMALRFGWGDWADSRAAAVAALPAALDARFGALRTAPDSTLARFAQAPLHRSPLPMWVCDRLAQRPGWRPYDLVDGVAMLPVSGLIVPELGAIGCSAATGCAELLWLASMAGADPDVRGIALMVDSGGGEVNGVDEAARALRRLDKPVAAVVTGDAYSAAYWLASAADSIAVARTGGVGSIGIIAEHWDDSAYLGRLGIARTVVARGDRKADFHPTLTAEGRAQLDAEVKALRAAFVDTVARHRAIDAGAVLATKSRSFKGADQLGEARQLGLIDAIAFPDEALTAFGAFLMRPAA